MALLDEPFMNEARAELGTPDPASSAAASCSSTRRARSTARAYDPSLPFPDQPFEPYPFVASHDRNPRLASDIEEMKRHGMSLGVDEAYRLALYPLLTLSSHPVLYLGRRGDAAGMEVERQPADANQNPGDGSGIYDETLREPFPWFASGQGPGQTRWFQSRFDLPADGVSREEQGGPAACSIWFAASTNLRTRHPALASGEIGEILSDSTDWMVFERTRGSDHYLVLINRTATGHDYRFHAAWFPQFRGADLIFWSDGRARKWKDASADGQRIGDAVFVPPVGLVVIRRRS